MLSGNGRSYTWYSFNKPNEIYQGGKLARYGYDADFNRVKKETIDSTTLYFGKLYEKQTTGAYINNKYYVYADKRLVSIYEKDNSGAVRERFVHTDHLGSIESITDNAQQVIERLSFDAHGKRRNPNWTDSSGSISSVTSKGFTGHEMDDSIGLINMNARIYDPVIGRFISPDTVIQYPYTTQGYNRYTYVNNNPLSFTDPSGHFLNFLFGWVAQHFISTAVANALDGYFFGDMIAAMAGGTVFAGVVTDWNPDAMKDGALAAFAFYWAGEYSYEKTWKGGSWQKVVLHGTVGGAITQSRGGDFWQGFASAGLAQKSASWIDGVRGSNEGAAMAKRVVASAVMGGLGSRIAGGDFESGAVTAAFARMFNEGMHQATAKRVAKEVSERGYFKGKGEADWIYQNNGDPDLVVNVDASHLTVAIDGEWAACPNGQSGVCAAAHVTGEDYWVHGQGLVRMRPNGTFGLYDQRYHYEIHNSFRPIEVIRNIATFIGSPPGGWPNTPFWIHYSGNVGITNSSGEAQ